MLQRPLGAAFYRVGVVAAYLRLSACLDGLVPPDMLTL